MAKKTKKNLATVNAVINNTQKNYKEEKNMKSTKSVKNTKITAVNDTTTTKKENKNMKNEIIGATTVLTKTGCGTITFTQKKIGDPVTYTVFKVPCHISADEAKENIKKFVANGWKITEIVEHKASSVNKPTVNYSSEYQKRIAEINGNSEQKVESIEKPKKADEVNKKPTTYTEAIEAKYGPKEARIKRMQRKSQLWNEMKDTIRAEVKKTGKYLRKDAWVEEMYTRLEKNPEWMEITGGKRQ